LAKRIVPHRCEGRSAGKVVNFVDLRDAAIQELAQPITRPGPMSWCFDITATHEDRDTYDVVYRTAEQVFIPRGGRGVQLVKPLKIVTGRGRQAALTGGGEAS
jgi:imidazole glycerol phosphate synthase subunit HisF